MKWASGLAAILAVVCVSSSLSAEIIRNGGFEAVPGVHIDQGLLPDEWVQTSGVTPGADTYDNSGVYGIPAGAYAHFIGVPAYEGTRWVAGYADAVQAESFGQLLTAPLTPGQDYEISAFLHASYTYPGPGGFGVYLAPGASEANAVYLGQLGPTTEPSAWEFATFVFTAPVDADALPYLLLKPTNAVQDVPTYVGIDAVSLNAVPEPATLSLLGLGLAGLVARRRKQHV